MKTDAYATSVALVALAESKVIKVNDPPYRRGIDYLLSTQFPDGSWHVRSRAIKFQPYFESGFPFGHDQWISAAATAWAAQALALSIGPLAVTAIAR
jgi:squalene cyclase